MLRRSQKKLYINKQPLRFIDNNIDYTMKHFNTRAVNAFTQHKYNNEMRK